MATELELTTDTSVWISFIVVQRCHIKPPPRILTAVFFRGAAEKYFVNRLTWHGGQYQLLAAVS